MQCVCDVCVCVCVYVRYSPSPQYIPPYIRNPVRRPYRLAIEHRTGHTVWHKQMSALRYVRLALGLLVV